MYNIEDLKTILPNLSINYNENLKIDKNYTYGFEIEFVKGLYSTVEKNIKILENKWSIYQDSSVWEYNESDTSKNKGGEVNSPIINDKTNIWKDLKDVLNIIKNANGKVDERVASHIHVGSQAFENEKYLNNFLLIWSCYEDIINKFFAGEYINQKENNILSKDCKNNLCESNFNIENLIHIRNRYSNIIPLKTYSISLYYFKHFNYEIENTIEFRNIRGTLEEEIWQNNMIFLTNLIKFSKQISKNELQYLKNKYIDKNYYQTDNLNSEKSLELANFIYNNEIEKLYFLKQYFKDFKESKDENKRIKLIQK